MSDTITCPNCDFSIEVTEVLSAQLRAQLQKEFEAEIRRKELALAEREKEVSRAQEAVKSAQEDIDHRVAEKLEQERKQLSEAALAKAREQVTLELRDKDEQLTEAPSPRSCPTRFRGHSLHRIATLVLAASALMLSIDAVRKAFGANSPRVPNIVLIMADDMGYECVGANGSTFYKTPNLDRLARGGMRFEHAYSQPICTPSRVQIMTGRYNGRNYVRFGYLHPDEVTFGNVMKQAGYKTCIAGKWQLKGGFAGPNQFGFDEYCLWQLTRIPSRYPNPGLEINGKEVDYRDGEYGPDLVSDYLIEFMRRHKDGPFFAYYPMILPHWPFQPTPDSPDWDPKETKSWPREKWDRQHFSQMVTYADKMVGKIDRALDDLGIRENTLLIFTCDNGTYTGITSPFQGKQVTGGKGSTPNAGTHVPMIASWPGTIRPGRVSQDLIDFSDVLPTLADLGGGQVPQDRKIDGRSFLPQLKGEKGNPRDWVSCWYERNGKRDGRVLRYTRDRTYKLYHDGRFFNVPVDELEKHPLDPNQLDAKTKQVQSRLKVVVDRLHAEESEFSYTTKPANSKGK